METGSHNPSGSTRQAKAEANQSAQLPILRDNKAPQTTSAGQGCEERDSVNSRSSRPFDAGCADLLHKLANTSTGVLMNAQMLAWKLPPYSHWRRPLREIERNAQRAGELIKRLLRRLSPEATGRTNDPTNEPKPGVSDHEWELVDAVAAQGPGVGPGSAENLPPPKGSRPAPGFIFAPEVELEAELTSPCDVCPSTFPKKG